MTVSTTNGVSGERLRSFIERIEHIRADKKDLAEDEKVVMAELKADGFDPAIVRHVVKIRAAKPADVQEAQILADMYLSALGMAPEPPLFRAANLMAVDTAAKESVIEALKKFVPDNGSIVVEAGGVPMRLTRDKDGVVSVADVIAPKPQPSHHNASSPSKPRADVPDVTADEAEALGKQAAKDNKAVISNPFPFGDSRRARWDGGWRIGAGNDGMGPS